MPTPIIQTDVTAFAPELSVLSSGAWTDILAYVNDADLTQAAFCGTVPGEDAQTDRMFKIFLAAHIGTMAKRAGDGSAGPLTGASVGGVRRSFGLADVANGTALSTTRYGQMALDILGATGLRVGLVI